MRLFTLPITQPGYGDLSDLHALRVRARQDVEQGSVTPGYKAERATLLSRERAGDDTEQAGVRQGHKTDRLALLALLNDALATELVCFLRYKRHFYMATGSHALSAAAACLKHASEDLAHSDLLALRIVQLGGEPNLNPDDLEQHSHTEYVEGDDLVDMLREDLVAERITIVSYAELIRYVGEDDPVTRHMLENILGAQEAHAEDLVSLLRKRTSEGAQPLAADLARPLDLG